jgi:pilus assembly protein CpaE
MSTPAPIRKDEEETENVIAGSDEKALEDGFQEDVVDESQDEMEDTAASLTDVLDEDVQNDAACLNARPVPRITIHGFCESPETGMVLQRAASDRRLAKAHVTVHMGGIPAAVEQYKESVTPNLLLVEDRGSRDQVFENLAALATVCDPTTKVVVIGATNDVTLYRELIRQGVNEYLVMPLTPIQIIDSISTIYVDPAAPPVGRTIAFIGAKGGVGSSTMAHNVGWCISERIDEDVTIIDMDLSFGTAGLDFNQDPTQGIADALTAPDRLDDVLLDRLLVKCNEHLSLFAAPSVLDRDFDLDPESFEQVLEIVRSMVPSVIIDLPHIWSNWTKHILLSSDEVVITATPDLANLRNAKNLVDLIRSARPNDAPPRLVLNQMGVQKRPEIPAKDFAEAIGGAPALEIPFDAKLFGDASNNGQMIGEISGGGKVADGFADLAQLVSGREAPAPAPNKLLSWLGVSGLLKNK